MDITAKITGIEYTPKFTSELEIFDFQSFDINMLPSSCIVNFEEFSFGISKWVSPKRTRSYPYERVYNTLGTAKRITVIPIIKDEGKNGDRDFIQWDTVSLMSLLDVFVVFAYYQIAERHPTRDNKITKQQFDNELVKKSISEIKNYHSSALHWNLKQIEDAFPLLIEKAKQSYQSISTKLSIELHSFDGIDRFAGQFLNGVTKFMDTSREKAREAQSREIKTVQPKESLSTDTKATITIENYLGGKYYFTTDEIKLKDDKVYLIEGKHSRSEFLPSIGDIKDGLLKMILYSNLKDVLVDGDPMKSVPVLKLTSPKISDSFSSNESEEKLEGFFQQNSFSKRQKKTIENLVEESRINNFLVSIERSN